MDFDQQLEADLLAEARETAANLELILTSSGDDPEARLARLRREARILRMRGGARPEIQRIAREIDDTLAALDHLDAKIEARLLAQVARLEHAIAGRPAPTVEELRPRLERTLDPATVVAAFKEEEIKATNKRVLLVEPNHAVGRFVARELANCGYRVITARDGIDAMTCVFSDRPDLVLTSVELGEMSGIDLLTALSAMPSTAGVSLAVLTSYQLGDKSLQGLPPRVAVIAKGTNFSRDIADALIRLDVA